MRQHDTHHMHACRLNTRATPKRSSLINRASPIYMLPFTLATHHPTHARPNARPPACPPALQSPLRYPGCACKDLWLNYLPEDRSPTSAANLAQRGTVPVWQGGGCAPYYSRSNTRGDWCAGQRAS